MSTNSLVSFIDEIQAAVAKYVPTVESILAVGVSLFDPSAGPMVSTGLTIFNAIVADLEGVAQVIEGKPASVGAAATSDPKGAVHMGHTCRGVAVYGYHRA